MSALPLATLRKLMEATRLLHSHGQGTFHDRLLQALNTLYDGAHHALELYRFDGSYSIVTDIPFNERTRDAIIQRTSELVPQDSPMFRELDAGATDPMRLSDLMTLRQLRMTDLYHEVFRDVGITRQIGIPIQTPGALGGLTVNRTGKDYSSTDLLVASLLAPQIATAYEADRLLSSLKRDTATQSTADFSHLRRLGLTRRECEVLCWVVEGKRDAEIAIILSISVRTVNLHVRAVLSKLGVETRTAAVAFVVRTGALVPAAP